MSCKNLAVSQFESLHVTHSRRSQGCQPTPKWHLQVIETSGP